jgi:hypothetical protein
MRVTNKSRQKREQRMRRVRGEKRPNPNEQERLEHEKPVDQQLWFQRMFQRTLFDLICALQEGQPMRLEVLPKLDGWGVACFIMMFLHILSGAYARTLETPYRLPKMPLGQAQGPDVEVQGGEAGVPQAFATDDLYEMFTAIRGHRGARFQGGEAMGPEGKVASPKRRAKRDDIDQQSSNEIVNPLANKVVYPEEKLSHWMRGLINSVESVMSLLGPPLRRIGFEPDEGVDVKIARPRDGIVRMKPRQIKMTAAEFAMYVTTEKSPGYSVVPVTERGRELKRLITDSEKYGKESFFSKEAIQPVKHKYRHEGFRAIEDKFSQLGFFMERMATLYHVKANIPGEVMSSAFAKTYDGDLGTIVRLEGETPRFFAIVPHHPDLVISAVDPTSELEFGDWMRETGKYLFFREPDALRSEMYFFSAEEDRNNIEHSSDTLRGAVMHTLKPIIAQTMQRMTDLVVNDTPAERTAEHVLGLCIPAYDFIKMIREVDYKKAIVLVSFELIPYVGKGAKVLFKTTFRGGAARAVADQVGKWGGKAFDAAKAWGSSNAADRVVEGVEKPE